MSEENFKILFVDDDPNILNGFTRNLRGLFNFDTACGSESAIDILSNDDQYAVIVSDMRMDGLDGYQLIEIIRKISPNTVCIMLTGYAELNAALDAVNNNLVFRFLTKPCPRETLIQALNDAISQYRRQSETVNYTYSIEIEKGFQRVKRSSGCFAVTGYSVKEMSQNVQKRYQMIVPEHRKMYIEHFDRLVAGEIVPPIEFQIIHKDGKRRWLRDTSIARKNSNGRVYRCEGFVEDITPFKEISKRLQQSEARFERVTSNIPGVVFQCCYDKKDGDIDFTYISESSNEIFAMGPEELTGYLVKFEKIFDRETLNSLKTAVKISAQSYKSCTWQGQGFVHGRQRWFQFLAKPEDIGDGKCIFDGLILDITVRVRTETELRHANDMLKETNKLKSEIVSTVSHELRTPLFIFKNIISNALEGLYGKISKKMKDNLAIADTTIDRLARIISDFLDCSKIEAGMLKLDTKPVAIQEVINEVVQSINGMAREKYLNINCILPKSPLMVNGDADRLIQIMTNLIGNAIKFTDHGTIHIFVNDHINEIEVSVQDNGPGISKEDLEKIFNKFVRISNVVDKVHGGTGLGLHIVKELVDLHHGRIWVDSKIGQGSCFSFVLPKYIEAADTSEKKIQAGAEK